MLNQGQPVNHEDYLDHRYQILRLLGQSYSSQTYLTLDTATQTTAVVKQIKIDELNLESRLQQLKDLQHRRLSRWLDFSIEQGYLYGAQEYIAGESLATRLQRVGCFSVAELWLVLEQTLPVLQYLHRQGLLHGDIRPENLICRTGLDDLVLVDLAIMPTGNPEYAAPEQMQRHPVLASDLYSLGLTGLNLLTGLRPIEIWDTENSNSWRDYWLPDSTEPDPERLAQFIDRLLVADPTQRFTASEAIATVERLRGRKLRVEPAAPPAWHCSATLTGHQGLLASVNAVAAQANLLASTSDDKSIRLWQLPNGTACGEFLGHTGAVKAVAFYPHHPILASGSQDRSIKLWDCQTEQVIQTLVGHSGTVNALAFSPDAEILASGSSDKTVKFWRTGECFATLNGHRLAVNAIAFSPDGREIASASTDSTVRIWNLEGKCLQSLTGHTQAVRAIAFSPSGLLASGGDGPIRLWHLDQGNSRLLPGHPWAVSALLFSSDGQYLISASWDKTIKIWQVETGEELCALTGHTDSITSITLADGLLASSSKDKTVKLWDCPELHLTGVQIAGVQIKDSHG